MNNECCMHKCNSGSLVLHSSCLLLALGDSTAQNSVDWLVHLICPSHFHPIKDTLLLTALRNELIFAMNTVLDLSIVCSSHLTINMWMISMLEMLLKANISILPHQKYDTIVCCVTCEEAHYQNVGPLTQTSSWYTSLCFATNHYPT